MEDYDKQELIAELTEQYGKDVYTTDELGEAFEVHSFTAPFVIVTKKDTNEKGTLEFSHMPRVYFNFVKD